MFVIAMAKTFIVVGVALADAVRISESDVNQITQIQKADEDATVLGGLFEGYHRANDHVFGLLPPSHPHGLFLPPPSVPIPSTVGFTPIRTSILGINPIDEESLELGIRKSIEPKGLNLFKLFKDCKKDKEKFIATRADDALKEAKERRAEDAAAGGRTLRGIPDTNSEGDEGTETHSPNTSTVDGESSGVNRRADEDFSLKETLKPPTDSSQSSNQDSGTLDLKRADLQRVLVKLQESEEQVDSAYQALKSALSTYKSLTQASLSSTSSVRPGIVAQIVDWAARAFKSPFHHARVAKQDDVKADTALSDSNAAMAGMYAVPEGEVAATVEELGKLRAEGEVHWDRMDAQDDLVPVQLNNVVKSEEDMEEAIELRTKEELRKEGVEGREVLKGTSEVKLDVEPDIREDELETTEARHDMSVGNPHNDHTSNLNRLGETPSPIRGAEVAPTKWERAALQEELQSHTKGTKPLDATMGQTTLQPEPRLTTNTSGWGDGFAALWQRVVEAFKCGSDERDMDSSLASTSMQRAALQSRLALAERERDRLAAAAETLRQQIGEWDELLKPAGEETSMTNSPQTDDRAQIDIMMQTSSRLKSRLAQAEGEMSRLAIAAEMLQQQIQVSDKASKSASKRKMPAELEVGENEAEAWKGRPIAEHEDTMTGGGSVDFSTTMGAENAKQDDLGQMQESDEAFEPASNLTQLEELGVGKNEAGEWKARYIMPMRVADSKENIGKSNEESVNAASTREAESAASKREGAASQEDLELPTPEAKLPHATTGLKTLQPESRLAERGGFCERLVTAAERVRQQLVEALKCVSVPCAWKAKDRMQEVDFLRRAAMQSRLAQVELERDRLVAAAETLREQIRESDEALKLALVENTTANLPQEAVPGGSEPLPDAMIQTLEVKILRLRSRLTQALGERDRLAAVAEMLQQIVESDEPIRPASMLTLRAVPEVGGNATEATRESAAVISEAEVATPQQSRASLPANVQLEVKQQVVGLMSRLAEAEAERDRLAAVAETLQQRTQESDEAFRRAVEDKLRLDDALRQYDMLATELSDVISKHEVESKSFKVAMKQKRKMEGQGLGLKAGVVAGAGAVALAGAGAIAFAGSGEMKSCLSQVEDERGRLAEAMKKLQKYIREVDEAYELLEFSAQKLHSHASAAA